MAQVVIDKVSKVYENGFAAVTDANFTVEDQEFLVLVGPSGCGKSTLLRMIAGLEEISDGSIQIGGKVVNEVPPRQRDIAMVFQNYALYPHMNVFDNMAMGLRIRKTSRDEIDRSVREAALLLGIESLLERRPAQLSGGQRQRVAVGRAIVRRPQVFLFDEPLSNLDPEKRTEMRTEISRLHHRLEATMVYVTHDQTEAMTMGHRIVVLKDGHVQQVDTPMQLYNRPANRFVASFVGSPHMNFFEARLELEDGGRLQLDGVSAAIAGTIPPSLAAFAGRDLILGVRPEDIGLADEARASDLTASLDSKLEVIEPLGSETLLYWDLGHGMKISRANSRAEVSVGMPLRLSANLRRAHLFDPESGETLLSWPG